MFPARLTAGYRAFLGGRFADERTRYKNLARTGQQPEIMVIGCVDSRVSPEVIFNAAPGELLVVRNVAALVPAYDPVHSSDSQHGTSAALEFGVQALRVRHIVVLGHALCGGIRAFADKQKPLSSSDFIGRWMSQIGPAAESLEPASPDETSLRRLELASIELSLKNLMTFPWVRILVEQGKLTLHGAYFGIATGHLLVRDPQSGRFEPAVKGMPRTVLRASGGA
jgi:carbonic anhydrase